MAYPYKFSDLLTFLKPHAPQHVARLATDRYAVRRGLLPVGLKLHYLGSHEALDPLVKAVGGEYIFSNNLYRREDASLCLVLHPVGNPHLAIYLIEAIEAATHYPVFKNPLVQIQVCSAGRLEPRRAAMLAIGFYLASDSLRHYRLDHFATTFSENAGSYTRGRRFVLYDAQGTFETEFEWWGRRRGGKLKKHYQLPMTQGRTDVLTARSKIDTENINLLATLLVHEQFGGYWAELGRRFMTEVAELLERHQLSGLLAAPWLRDGDVIGVEEAAFQGALQELMNYAFDEFERIEHERERAGGRYREPSGILWEMKNLIDRYRILMRVRFIHEPQEE